MTKTLCCVLSFLTFTSLPSPSLSLRCLWLANYQLHSSKHAPLLLSNQLVVHLWYNPHSFDSKTLFLFFYVFCWFSLMHTRGVIFFVVYTGSGGQVRCQWVYTPSCSLSVLRNICLGTGVFNDIISKVFVRQFRPFLYRLFLVFLFGTVLSSLVF